MIMLKNYEERFSLLLRQWPQVTGVIQQNSEKNPYPWVSLSNIATILSLVASKMAEKLGDDSKYYYDYNKHSLCK